jgi:hypothetical protein
MSRLLSQGQAERIFPAAMFDCLFNISGQTVKMVCRTGSINTLMGTLASAVC